MEAHGGSTAGDMGVSRSVTQGEQDPRWQEARETMIFRGYLERRSTPELMGDHDLSRQRISMIIRRRLRRLRERDLHRRLEEVGCPMKYVAIENARVHPSLRVHKADPPCRARRGDLVRFLRRDLKPSLPAHAHGRLYVSEARSPAVVASASHEKTPASACMTTCRRSSPIELLVLVSSACRAARLHCVDNLDIGSSATSSRMRWPRLRSAGSYRQASPPTVLPRRVTRPRT